MERRILLAFTLSFLVFALYLRFVAPRPAVVEPPSRVTERGPERPAEDIREREPDSPLTSPRPPSEVEREKTEVREAAAEQQITVETPLYRARWTNRGARLMSFVLKQYEDSQGKAFEMIPIEASERLDIRPFDVVVDDPEVVPRLRAARFEVSTSGLRLSEGDSGEIAFTWADGTGWEVSKRFQFSGSSYLIESQISVEFAGREVPKKVLYGPGVGEESATGTYATPDKGVIKAGEEVERFDAGDIEDGQGAGVAVEVVGVASHYFAALMLPKERGAAGAELSKTSLELEGGRTREFITAALDVPTRPASFTTFVGPKDHELLAALGPGLEYIIEYGAWMRFLALPLRSALLWIHEYVGSYGWSIVLLTVVINLALFPLKHHSYVSMRKMQKLGPQVKRIQERYKKLKPTDPRRQEMNKEVYQLYREHNVSPVSGCLPMLMMIPFFFAFYQLLRVMIELRHAPFLFWIQDLSTFDPFFILPILMGVSQLAMQKMTPQTTADPIQAKVMMLMPLVFMFILAWAPAGLVLYWFVNNLVSIGQQTLTNRLQSKEEEAGTGKKNGVGKGKGKSRKNAKQTRS